MKKMVSGLAPIAANYPAPLLGIAGEEPKKLGVDNAESGTSREQEPECGAPKKRIVKRIEVVS